MIKWYREGCRQRQTLRHKQRRNDSRKWLDILTVKEYKAKVMKLEGKVVCTRYVLIIYSSCAAI